MFTTVESSLISLQFSFLGESVYLYWSKTPKPQDRFFQVIDSSNDLNICAYSGSAAGAVCMQCDFTAYIHYRIGSLFIADVKMGRHVTCPTTKLSSGGGRVS